MKITYNPKSFLALLSFFVLVVLMPSSVNAQIYNKGNLYISNNSTLFQKLDFKFGTSGTTSSARTTTIGTLSFAANATSSGVSGTHFMDGYVRKYGTGSFIYPIGQTSTYAPIIVNPTLAAVNGVDAAYYIATFAATNINASTVKAFSTLEYWDIKGTSAAAISLTWRTSSDVRTLTSTELGNPASAVLTNLIIVGYKNATSQWEQIPSTIDATSILGTTSDFDSGSISSIGNVSLNDYSAFTIGAKGSCEVLVTFSGVTKTWNGTSWSSSDLLPTPPTLVDNVVISSPYNSILSFQCNSLELNANVTLTGVQSIEIVNGVTGSGVINMSSQSSVVQRNSSATAPIIVLTKKTREMKMLDYIYWGTPISGDFYSQIAGAKALGESLSAFDLKYRYQTGSGGGWKTLSTTETGRGFITRIKQQAPFINTSARGFINFTFTGTANNGDITVAGMRNQIDDSILPDVDNDHELLANPYPSSLDIAKFLDENQNLDGSVYLWSSGTAPDSVTGLYTISDYTTWTRLGETAANLFSPFVGGKIASGQSFRVKVKTDNSSSTFTNCMRVTSGNTNFFRNANETLTIDRFKLNMTGSNGIFSQILIGYIQGATYGLDRDYDAVSNSVSGTRIYSILGNNQLVINGRNPYDVTDVIPLGVSKVTTNTEIFTVSLVQQEGIFASGAATVYLHDILLGVYHNFVNGDYVFTTNALSANSRFEIVYADPSVALNNSEFTAGQVVANVNANVLSITTSNEMESVEIFDLTGRKVLSFETVNANNLSKSFNYSEGIYIAKIKLSNGVIATQKLINKK